MNRKRGIRIQNLTRKPVFENELIKLTENLPVSKFTDEDFKAVSSGDYLPRLQLMISNSDPCKDGKFPINHFALVQDKTLQDLGGTVDIAIFAWRPKALEIGENVISSYSPKSDLFLKIQARASEPNSGCMYGPEFLVWVPSVKSFATFYMGSGSLRRVSNYVMTKKGQAITLKPEPAKNKKGTWFFANPTACSTPFDLPPVEKVVEQCNKFNNPPESEVEIAETKDDRAR